ncbi:TPA: restriction endonuclease subunit S [Burkholderia vietnamiensis]|uniref:restriction endonuclease subunit S n=1 Tax=Burkholderia vietnamiensis TaxID=60552 RepID=UPI001BA047F5|nr:restriction endonuclease subunit S [Burkholderia vietnamiensis]MBR8163818.1 restriction endonuclease subunit S [Burkholderia vietnamiensis]MCA8149302.1 restriction endonuclease subunit S [Burkholderia vietnamiensis]HDR8945586.1 restriction endonuclease subunit S [Burkholderia vietnamiensis]HDR9208945.1 restriction endonuclease subunit S [Burkholderia vietnamiensis]
MSEWPTVRFGDLFQIKHGFAFKGEYFSDEPGPVVLTPGNFEARGGLKLRPGKDRSYDGEFPEAFKLKVGELLVVMTDLTQEAAILGAPAFVSSDIACLHNQRLGKIVDLKADRLDLRFLYYLCNTHDYREYLRSTATGSTVKHTSPGRICDFAVSLPPIETQRRIAGILGAYDDLIEVNRRRIAVLKEMAQALFTEWFTHLRFPGHEDVVIEDTPEGRLPSGWVIATLGELCAGKSGIQTGPFGSQLHQEDYADEGVPVVMPKNIIDLRIETDGIARIPPAIANSLGRHLMVEGDVVYGRRGDIGRRALISRAEAGYFCGTGCLRLRPDKNKTVPHYLFMALGTPETEGAIKARATGATMPNLNVGVMQDVPVLNPPVAIQRKFDAIIGPIQETITNLVSSSANLAAARDLLLPRLVSGQLSVTQAKRELEAA